MSEPIVDVKGITKIYRNGRGLHDVSFEVEKGDVYGLCGPNGAGKTTLLKMLVGLIFPDRGSIRLFGHAITDHFEKAMEQVSCMFESMAAYPYLTACENLKLAARFYPELPKNRSAEVLEWVGLEPYRHEKVADFSLGMKRRLALAAALLSDPKLVILDEPTNGLDIEGTLQMRQLITRLARESGTAFLISSHMIGEMEKMCNRIGILYGGRLILQAKVNEWSGTGRTLEHMYMSEIGKAQGV
ncbi:ABC transporter ATP-binding protein [Brevibacillus migulae]|uniref:ABC transporter ATP-binding protein n=1 Tax=Brevibacillus migulae TaxID=1644114 RepID=UPI00106ECC0D|nr:ABC transporter ATP-binding protein [Brevibacillus migulae]